MRPKGLVVIGASWGGLDALRVVLGALDRGFPAAIVVVQHRSEDGDQGLLRVLQQGSGLPVSEVEDKDVLVPGHVYLAPAGYHVLVDGERLALSVDPPVSRARPSIDVLFESAADAYGRDAVGVILTGAGHDGARGAAAIKRRGGILVVEDPSTAESRTLPEAVLSAAAPDRVLALAEIVPYLVERLRRAPTPGAPARCSSG